MDNIKPNNKLSWWRFIPLLLVILLGSVFICSGNVNTRNFSFIIDIIDYHYRNQLIYFTGICVGIFHYYYNGRRHNQFSSAWANILFGVSRTLFSAMGYSLAVNKAMNVGVGLLKEHLGIQKFFVDPSQVDMLSLGVIVVLIIFIGIWEIWVMISQIIFKASHNVETPNPDVQKNKEENSRV